MTYRFSQHAKIYFSIEAASKEDAQDKAFAIVSGINDAIRIDNDLAGFDDNYGGCDPEIDLYVDNDNENIRLTNEWVTKGGVS